MPTRKWTREQALAAGVKGRAALAAKRAKLKEASATLQQLRRTKSPLQALDVLLAGFYRDLAKLCSHSSAAERLSRTIFNLEQIRRIHSKGRSQEQAAPAVSQLGPIGIAGSEEPKPDEGEPADPSTPEMSPEL
jgi:hypothetical protein